MAGEEHKLSPIESMFSPRFKSVAAMAGWDEETLLSASLIVDDTPDRQLSHKQRTVFPVKTPPSANSRKKRRVERSSVPIVVLDLNGNVESIKNETNKDKKEEKKETEDVLKEKSSDVTCSTTSLPCMDKLREELSCAICLDICFEPSTTPCGHSFCLKCLQFAASKCGKKCPKCRQLISNGRSCTVNTVLWNTIQLLFPEEVGAKKAATASNCRKISNRSFCNNLRNGSSHDSETRMRATQSQNEDDPIASLVQEIRRNIRSSSRMSSSATPSQDEDAAFALGLQREEFMGGFRGTNTTRLNRSSSSTSSSNLSTNPIIANSSVSQSSSSTITRRSSSSFSLARENLRAMASRATRRVRG